MRQDSEDPMCQDTKLDPDYHITSLADMHSPEWDTYLKDNSNKFPLREPIINNVYICIMV